MELLARKGFKLSIIMRVGLFTVTAGESNPGLRPGFNPYLQIKERLEDRKSKLFTRSDHQTFIQHKASLERLEQASNIQFIDNKSQEQKDLINELLSFELTYLGYKDELPSFELRWIDYFDGLEANAGGEVKRAERYKYLGIMQLEKFESDEFSLNQIMTSEARHVAQHLLRDLHDLDNDSAELFYNSYNHAFLEGAEHLNNWLYNSVNSGADIFRETPTNFDLSRIHLDRVFDISEPHESAEAINALLLVKIKQWNSLDPISCIRAYSKLLTLVDFSPVGSFINSIDRLVDETLSYPDSITKLQQILEKNRADLTKNGTEELFQELITAVPRRDHARILQLKQAIKEPHAPSLNSEEEYCIRILSRLMSIESPEELYKLSEEAIRTGRFLAA